MARIENSSAPMITSSDVDATETEATSAPVPEASHEAATEDRVVSEENAPNRYVAAVQDLRKPIDDLGADELTAADEAGHQRDLAVLLAQQQAKAAMSSGHPLAALGHLVTGLVKATADQAEQLGHYQNAIGASVLAGVADVAEGKKEALEKVAWGGVAIAVISTGGAALPAVLGGTGEAALPALAGGVGDAMFAHEVINGSGEMVRAKDAKEFLKAGLKVEVALVMKGGGSDLVENQIEKVGGSAIEKGCERVGSKLAEAAVDLGGKTSLEGLKLGLVAGAKITEAAAESAPVAVTKLIGTGIDQLVGKNAENLADALGGAEKAE